MAERKPKNTSKIEVIAHKNEIEESLSSGYNYMQVFKKLQEQNKISCKYHAFLKALKNICEVAKISKSRINSNKKEKIENKQADQPTTQQTELKKRHHAELQENKSFKMMNEDYTKAINEEGDKK